MEPTNDQQPGSPLAEAPKTEPAEHMIPKSRFDEVNKKLAKLEADAAKRDQEQRQAADAAAAQRGEYEKLATERGSRLAQIETEHTTLNDRYTALTEEMEGQIKARVKALPEKLRDLLTDGDVLTRYRQLAKLEAAAAELAPRQEQPRSYDINAGARGSGGQTPDDIMQANRQRLLTRR